jgi:hypothetical protein
MARDNLYLQEAFEAVIKDAKIPEQWYVVLIEIVPFYGGPEEGGWWGCDTHVVAFKEYPTEELAQAAAEQVRKLAKELTDESYREYGDYCLRRMDWLEDRGLDSDFLLEPNGPSEYSVLVTNEIPKSTYGCRRYE